MKGLGARALQEQMEQMEQMERLSQKEEQGLQEQMELPQVLQDFKSKLREYKSQLQTLLAQGLQARQGGLQGAPQGGAQGGARGALSVGPPVGSGPPGILDGAPSPALLPVLAEARLAGDGAHAAHVEAPPQPMPCGAVAAAAAAATAAAAAATA